ncbi:hypothetical protein C0J52_22690 [Blattella germanica]|nr:hypothetical protein C0J52_22690 [Blattella germanica]
MLSTYILPGARALYGADEIFYHLEIPAFLDDNLQGRWVGQRGHIEFPLRSPDLTPRTFTCG